MSDEKKEKQIENQVERKKLDSDDWVRIIIVSGFILFFLILTIKGDIQDFVRWAYEQESKQK